MSLAEGLDNNSVRHSILKSLNAGKAAEADSTAEHVPRKNARRVIRSKPSTDDSEAKMDSVYYDALEEYDIHALDFLPTLLKSFNHKESVSSELPVQTKDRLYQVQSSEDHFGIDLCSRIIKHDIAPATPPKEKVISSRSKQIALPDVRLVEQGEKVLSLRLSSMTGNLNTKRLSWSPLENITFKSVWLPEYQLSDKDARDLLNESFPDLCEVAVRKAGTMEELLPLTKKIEKSLKDKNARKEALILKFKGKKEHSLIKSVVNLESRSATWERLGPAEKGSFCLPLPLVPDPWDLGRCPKLQSDKRAYGGKTKHAFETKASRREGLCGACHGNGIKTCFTCNGQQLNVCSRCSGSGKKRNAGTCESCMGEGMIQCHVCAGISVRLCEPCKGQGNGLYAAIVHITFRRICFPPVPTSDVVLDCYARDPAMIRKGAIARTKEMISKLDTIRDARGTNAFRPISASCSWEISTSNLVEVDFNQMKEICISKVRKGLWRQSSLIYQIEQQKQLIENRFFMLPAEKSLQVLEMSKAEFKEALEPLNSRNIDIKYELTAPPFG